MNYNCKFIQNNFIKIQINGAKHKKIKCLPLLKISIVIRNKMCYNRDCKKLYN